ncbi:MAG TPA: SH3 domain-containing protein, partial [Candidatus Limnocylindria bacterium]|nr:SH3 domain-containing protein [Candidatus Limnocylindria bacterium]
AAVPTGASANGNALNVQTGATVTVTDDGVNMRDQPATSGKVVATLPKGEQLEITGDPQTADGYRWYPVKDVKTGKTGYVVQDFLAPA